MFETAIETYARQSCITLTRNMHAKLPRELRDIVYEHLLDAVPDGLSPDLRLEDVESECLEPREANCVHFLDSAFMHIETLYELAYAAEEKEALDRRKLLGELTVFG